MEGYVYIARIIDHGGKFVNGYHKIGLSKQYKVRETQLNSTHLPFDVLMTRVFESEDMNKLEGILHLCFEDYRVIKEYDDRRNITTEWFDVSDIDMFNERLDKFIGLYGVSELDLNKTIEDDTTMTQEEKMESIENVRKAKSSRLCAIIGNETFEKGTQKDLFIKCIGELINQVGNDGVCEFSRLVRPTAEDFNDYKFSGVDVYNTPEIVEVNGSYLWVSLSANEKIKTVNKICERFNINNVELKRIG